MRMSAKHIVTLSLVLQGMGCVATQHEFEQTAIRQTVLHLYEEQIMDNLIRVYNLRPIIQMKYSGITGQIKETAGGSFGGSQEDAAGVIVNMFNYKAEASRENTLSVTANPILDSGSWEKQPARIVDGREIATYEKKESIYQRYVRFVWKLGPKVTDVITKPLEEKIRRAILDAESVATKPVNAATKRENEARLQTLLDERKAPPQPPAQFRIPSQKEDLNEITDFKNWLTAINAALSKLNRPEVEVVVPNPEDIDELSRLTGMLVCEPDEPLGQPRVYHEKKKYKGKYDDKAQWCWIPIEYRNQYFELAQNVTGGLGEAAQRGATSDGVLTELRLQRIRN